jgi:hypothetical protein
VEQAANREDKYLQLIVRARDEAEKVDNKKLLRT